MIHARVSQLGKYFDPFRIYPGGRGCFSPFHAQGPTAGETPGRYNGPAGEFHLLFPLGNVFANQHPLDPASNSFQKVKGCKKTINFQRIVFPLPQLLVE